MAKYTLTDIQRGIWELKLHSVLDEEFKLFWGLVMTSNALRFKNPIEVVNAQAMVLAKVNSREMLRRRRNALTKKRIYGNWILRYKSGNKMFNESGKYEINLDFLASAASAWSGKIDPTEGLSTPVDKMEQSQRQKGCEKHVFSEPVQSGVIIDSSEGLSTGVDSTVDNIRTEPLTTPLTTLRSEENIKEEDSSVSQNEKENGERRQWVLKELSDLYGYQVILNSRTGAEQINEIGSHSDEELTFALDTIRKRKEQNPGDLSTPSDAMAYMKGILKNRAKREKIAAKKRKDYWDNYNADFDRQSAGLAEDRAQRLRDIEAVGGLEQFNANLRETFKEIREWGDK